MPYTLDTFSKQVPPALLKQAQALVAAGQVHNLEHLGIEWVADVGAGTGDDEAYSVSIAVGPRGELLATCTCDDEENDLCRHAVAALLAAVKLEPAAAVKSKPAQPTAKAAKKPAKSSAAGRLLAALEATPPAALVELLMTLSKGDKHLQNRIYLEIADVGASMDSFTVALKAALSPRGGIRAWYDARSAKAAAKQVDTLLDRAQQAASEGNVDNGVRMAMLVHEQIMLVLQSVTYCHPIENNATRATNIVEAYVAHVSESVRNDIFQSLARSIRQAKRTNDERILALKQMLVVLVKTPAERQLVEPLLTPPKVSGGYYSGGETWNPAVNAHYLLQFTLIERLDGARSAERFAMDHVSYAEMRRVLIERAVARGDLNTVKQLATEGLRLSEKARLTDFSDYYRSHLIAIAAEQGDQRIADLFLAQFISDQTLDNLKQYKQSVPAAAWPKARAKLLASSGLHQDTPYLVYHTEEMWRELMDLLTKRIDSARYVIDALHTSGVPLATRFPDEVTDWCTRTIDKAVKRPTTSRAHYYQVASILKMMRTVGLSTQATAIAARLRESYSSRPALVDLLVDL